MSKSFRISSGRKVKVPQHAARILSSATDAVARILEKRDAMDRAGAHDKTLFVVAGEYHNYAAHVLHHMTVLKKLKGHVSNLAVGYEYSHNVYKQYFYPKGAAIKVLSKERSDSPVLLKAIVGFEGSEGSNSLETARFFHFLLKEEIPTIFTDAAAGTDFLNIRDRGTRRQMVKCVGFLGSHFSLIDATSVKGMKIRNHFAVVTAMEYAKESKPRIFFQQCGNDHVTGNPNASFEFQDSLCGVLKKASTDFFALPVEYDVDPANVDDLTPDEFHIAKDLPQIKGSYMDLDADLELNEDQSAYFNAVMERVGLNDHVMADNDFYALNSQFQRDAINLGREVFEEGPSL